MSPEDTFHAKFQQLRYILLLIHDLLWGYRLSNESIGTSINAFTYNLLFIFPPNPKVLVACRNLE